MASGYKPLHKRDDKDVLKIIKEDFEASESDRELKNEENYRAYRMFMCRDLLKRGDVIEGGEYVLGANTPTSMLSAVDVSKTFLPWLRGIVLTSTARISNGLWPDFNDFFRIDPDDESDEAAAEAAFGLTQYFIRASRYKQEQMLSLLNCHLYDFAITYTGWKREFGVMPRVIDYEQEMKNFETGEYEKTGEIDAPRRKIDWEETETDGWDVASINPFNFRVDPMAQHDDFGEFCGLTTLISKRRMWELAEAGVWDKAACREIDDEEEPNDAGDTDRTADIDRRIKEDEGHAGFDMESYIAQRYVRANLYWTPDSKAVVLNGRKVALKEKSWRIPFHKTVFLTKQGMFGGDSMVKPLIPAQLDMNQCLRLLRTQQDRAVNPDSVVDSTFFSSIAEAEAQPWGTGATMMLSKNPAGRDPQTARRFIYHPSNTAPDLWNSIDLQKSVSEQAVGVSEQAQGQPGASGQTATAVRDAQAGTNIRFAWMEVGIEQSMVMDPIKDLVKLIQLNVTAKRKIRIRGPEGMQWKEIGPQEMLMKESPDIVALGMSAMASRSAAAQAVRDVTTMFAANPVFQQHLKPLESMREIYRLHDVDPDIYVNDQDPSHAMVVVPPEWVPEMLAQGKKIPINAFDDHIAVLEALVEYTQRPEFKDLPESVKRLFLDQIKLRKSAMDASRSGGIGAPSLPNEGGGGGGPMAAPPGPQQPDQSQGGPPVAPSQNQAAPVPRAAPVGA